MAASRGLGSVDSQVNMADAVTEMLAGSTESQSVLQKVNPLNALNHDESNANLS